MRRPHATCTGGWRKCYLVSLFLYLKATNCEDRDAFPDGVHTWLGHATLLVNLLTVIVFRYIFYELLNSITRILYEITVAFTVLL